MDFFFARDMEGLDYGWLFFVRPSYLARRQYNQVPMSDVTILDHEGSWFGAFYYTTDGAGQRRLRRTLVFFGSGRQVWARMHHNFREVAKDYHIKPLKVIQDESIIRLEDCRYCKGAGKTETPPLYEYLQATIQECYSCVGTGKQEVEEREPAETPQVVPYTPRLLREYEEHLGRV